MASITYEVDPISRIEGHLGVKVTASDADPYHITEADAHGNLWRGFENFLIGRRVNDAITFTQRICGVCPVPHGLTSTYAADSVMGYSNGYLTFAQTDENASPNGDGVPKGAVLVRNMILAAEFLMSSITHFYHLAAQSYVQGPAIPPWTPYFDTLQYHEVLLSKGRAIPTARASATYGAGDAAVSFLGGDTAVTVTFSDPAGVGKALSVVVAGKAITVSLATDSGGVLSSTAADVAAAINASTAAVALVRATEGDTGLGFVAAGSMPTLVIQTGAIPADLWSAVIKQYVKALRIRRLCLEAGALFAGRMPMTSVYVAGGTTNTFVNQADLDRKCDQFSTLMTEVGEFVIREYIPLTLALGALYPEFDNNQGIDGANVQGFGAGVGNFLAWGGFPGIDSKSTLALKGGVWVNKAKVDDLLIDRDNLTAAKGLVQSNLKEFIERSRYANTNGYSDTKLSAFPGDVTATEPKRDSADKYSWMKAPRWNKNPMEVGPLARMVINGKYLVNGGKLVDAISGVSAVRDYASIYLASSTTLNLNVVHPDLVAGLAGDGLVEIVESRIANLRGGLSTMDRLRARAIESFWMINFLLGDYNLPASPSAAGSFHNDGWVSQLKAHEWSGSSLPKFCRDTTPPPRQVSGYGLTEAPRGALGHFVTASAGKIVSYQCVVPTTWNGSPKDGPDSGLGTDPAINNGNTKRGPMEQAMIGVPFNATKKVTLGADQGSEERLSGVEVLRVAQSFDPCIACAVH